MPKSRRQFTAELKAKIVLEVIGGVEPATEVRREHALRFTNCILLITNNHR
jgi:hypothetical protein